MLRKTILLATCLFLSIGLVLAGCGGGGDKKGGDGQECKDDGTCKTGLHCTQANVCMSEIALDMFAAETSAIYCQWLFGCCTQAELDGFEGGLIPAGTFDSQSTCVSHYRTKIQGSFTTPAGVAVTAGRGEYFADKAASCLAQGSGLTCSGNSQAVLQELLGLCDGAYNGLQTTDAECDDQVECQANLQCHAVTCKALLAENAACELGAGALLCGFGLYCDSNSLTCQPPAAAGQTCDSFYDSISCVVGYECTNPDATGYVCNEIEVNPVCDGL